MSGFYINEKPKKEFTAGKINEYTSKEYTLFQEKKMYKLLISRIHDKVILACISHEIKLSLNDLIKINKIFSLCPTIDDAYRLLTNLFDHNLGMIKEISSNKIIKLIITVNSYIPGIDEKLELNLIYSKENKDYIINELFTKYSSMEKDNKSINDKLNKLISEINEMKKEHKKMKEEIKELKSYHKIKSPSNINSLNKITKDSFSYADLDNTFTVFNSVDNVAYLIYATKAKSLISYDLNQQQINAEIKNAHDHYITIFKHCLDKNSNKDMVMSASKDDSCIKVWDIVNWECLLKLSNINKVGFLLSACFLYNKEEYYIVTSNPLQQSDISEQIKIYDFSGNRVKTINHSQNITYFIDTYYEYNKAYILSGNEGYAKSFDYEKNEIYHKYYDKSRNIISSLVVNSNHDDLIKLMESCYDGCVRIWNFHKGILLNKINTGNHEIRGICIWNDNYLFGGCSDNTIKLIDVKKGIVVNSLVSHHNRVCAIKKIFIPKYGECLLSQGWGNDQIQLWIDKKEVKTKES